MALTAGKTYARRGMEPSGGSFAYPVAAGVKVWRGAFVAVNSSGALVLIGAGGAVQFVGIADRDLDNSAGAGVSEQRVTALKGIYAITVPSATHSNINATVYATDDNTPTLTASTNLPIGTLVGIEGGQTYVRLLGS